LTTRSSADELLSASPDMIFRNSVPIPAAGGNPEDRLHGRGVMPKARGSFRTAQLLQKHDLAQHSPHREPIIQ
jgi:hypothetical protein